MNIRETVFAEIDKCMRDLLKQYPDLSNDEKSKTIVRAELVKILDDFMEKEYLPNINIDYNLIDVLEVGSFTNRNISVGINQNLLKELGLL